MANPLNNARKNRSLESDIETDICGQIGKNLAISRH